LTADREAALSTHYKSTSPAPQHHAHSYRRASNSMLTSSCCILTTNQEPQNIVLHRFQTAASHTTPTFKVYTLP